MNIWLTTGMYTDQVALEQHSVSIWCVLGDKHTYINADLVRIEVTSRKHPALKYLINSTHYDKAVYVEEKFLIENS
jgi:hypothetical protein